MDKVVVTLALPESWLKPLRSQFDLEIWSAKEAIPSAQLQEWLVDAAGLLCALSLPISRRIIEQTNSLRVISTISVGVDHIDLAAATERGIAVGHTPGVLVDSTADLTLALMLAVTRRVAEADRWIRAGHWTAGWQSGLLLGTDLSQATVGIAGLGPIGRAVARRLSSFGCTLLGWNRTPTEIPGMEMVSLDELFERSDVLTLHTALTEDTTHLANRKRLSAMRDGSVLVNTGRGLLVDEAALIEELSTGRLRAGLDVFEREPLPSDHPFLTLDNVVVLPHVGSATAHTRDAMVQRSITNLLAGMAGDRVPHCANPEVYDRRP